MRKRQGTTSGRAALVAALALVIALSPSASAYGAVPTTPGLTDVWVSNPDKVSLAWTASTDAGGHSITYDIFRHTVPITSTTIGSANLVGSTGDTIVEVSADVANGEVSQSYVWYYAVRSKETTTPAVVSMVSRSMAPNLHQQGEASSETCTRCHQVHGAYPNAWDYKDMELCYQCHASSAGSSPQADIGDKSTFNVKADFKEYAGQMLGSWHRSDTMVTNRTECDACHSAHRSPYNYGTSGTYDPAKSYRKMLRVQTGVSAGKPTYSYYSYNDDTLNPAAGENAAFCLACHGTNATPIAYVGDAGDYAATAGDHNSTNYATAAHGTSVVYSNDYGLMDAGEYPQVQCLACHDQHASAADKLIAYRGDDAGGAYAGAELCFACHGDSYASETRTSSAKAFKTWNERNVEGEFGRTSTHPVVPAEDGRSLACASCHNVHYVGTGGATAWDASRVSVPSGTKAAPSDMTTFCLDCHDGDPAAVTTDASTLVPHRIGFSPITAPLFPGWDKSGFTGSGHYTTAGQKALCKHCHDPHASDFQRLTAWTAPTVAEMPSTTWTPNTGTRANESTTLSQEQSLCYQCHGNGTTGKQAPGAKDVATKAATLTYAHDPGDDTNVHRDTESAADLGGTKRHAECEDCHNPHVAKTVGGTATQDTLSTSVAGGAVYGVYGLRPTYVTDAAPDSVQEEAYNWKPATSYGPDRLDGESGDYEAYLCLKCHSTSTQDAYPLTVTRADSTQYTGTDQALEFNPSNFSYHNVMGQSTGMWSSFTVTPANATTPVSVSWAVPTVDVFTAGYGPTTMLTCTSCHTNEADSATQAKGPHGSTVRWIIDPQYPTNWKTAGLSSGSPNGMEFVGGADATTIICAKCHDLYGTLSNDGNWSNTVHSKSAHMVSHAQPKYCTNCHIGIPHGWKRPRLLGYSDDPLPYRTVGGGSGGTYSYPLRRIQVNSSHVINGGSVSWAKGHCEVAPGGNSHTTNMQDYWP